MVNSELFCNSITAYQFVNKIILAMITVNNVVEFFFIIDGFCKESEQESLHLWIILSQLG